jgi:hypothetical protein
METQLNEVRYSKSFIQDLVLKHREEDINITPTRLNEIYPVINKQIFSGNFVALKRRNFVKGDVVEKKTHAMKRLSQLCLTLEEATDVEDKTNFGGKSKITARQIMSNWALKSGVVGKSFSFTHKEAELEQIILKDMPDMSFLSVDNDIEIIKAMKKTMKRLNLPLEIKHADAINVLRKVEPNELAHAFLDFCCQLHTASMEIRQVLDNDLVQINGTVAITVAKTVRADSKGYWFGLWKNFTEITSNQIEDNRTTSDVANIMLLTLLMNERYTIREVFNYRDTSPMTLFILQRIR